MSGRRRRADRGQATVELALLLPVVVMLMLVVGQVGVIVRTDVLVAHAAREGARAAAVGDDATAAALSGGRLDPARTTVRVEGGRNPGDPITVIVEHSAPARILILGRLLPDVELRAAVTMRREG